MYKEMKHLLGVFPFNMARGLFGDASEALSIYLPGVEKALGMLSERERYVLLARYCEGKTLKECSQELGVTRERVRQIQVKALRKLRHPNCERVLRAVPQEVHLECLTEIEKLKAERNTLRQMYEAKVSEMAGGVKYCREMSVLELVLSTRASLCLLRAGKLTLGQVADMTLDELLRVRNMGYKSAKEVVECLRKYGIQLSIKEEKRFLG